MFEQNLMYARDFFVRNFFVNIIGFKKNNNITWLSQKNIFGYIIGFLLKLLPLVITIKIANFFNQDVIYNYDNIYYISNMHQNKIIPVILELNAYCSNEPKYLYDIKYTIKYYNSCVPFGVFAKLNIPKIYDMVKLKYITKGIIKEKHLIINDYKNYLIYNLFEN